MKKAEDVRVKLQNRNKLTEIRKENKLTEIWKKPKMFELNYKIEINWQK